MCLIVFAYKQHPDYELILLANRDEFLARPTATAHWWEDHPHVLGGRDIQAGGTWMGISRQGRFSALTNYREPGRMMVDAPSRGDLVKDFLTGAMAPLDYLQEVETRKEKYNGFNLLVKDPEGLYYVSNRADGIHKLSAGLYGLSNHLLDTPWPKVVKAKAGLEAVISDKNISSSEYITVLSDASIAPDAELPSTGVPLEWERILSAMYILSPTYGTRATTLVMQDYKGDVHFHEQSRVPENETQHIFQVERTLAT